MTQDTTSPTGAREAGLAYWTDRLATAPTVLELVTDRVRPAVRRGKTATVPFTLSAASHRRLSEVAQEHGTTALTVLMAAFQVLMGRYADTRDVSVGTPAQATEPSPNMLVVRTHWQGDPTFTDLLALAHDAVGGATAHQDVPFARVVEALAPAADPSRTPLFQVSLSMNEDATVPAAAQGDLAVCWRTLPLPGGLAFGRLAYDTDLFERATAERLIAHYTTLLDTVLEAPGARLSRLAHTTGRERALVARWGTSEGLTRMHDVVEAFRAQAARTPGATALVCGDERLSYAELRARAERAAQALAARGVTTESVVALALDRSAAFVTTMLATLMAGAAYLPLDPAHPDARRAYMVQDSRAVLVVADGPLSFACDAPVVAVGDLAAPDGPRVALPPLHPEQLACVFYTSGSTGRPKGVGIPHRGIIRMSCDAPYLGYGPDDVVGQVASASFDISTYEVWGALLNGARLAIVPKEDAIQPEVFRTRIQEHGITALLLNTALFHQCADVDPTMFLPLRTLFFGGEEADARRVSVVRAACPGLRLANAYGPTESTTIASFHEVTEAVPSGTRLPIGRPVADTTLHVLDEYGRETGVGVPGELHIGAAGLARGYLSRPDLTAQRFVPSRFVPGERLYRTGDVTRWREDGTVEYLGRADTQVKIRGVRIETEEIASVLGTHEGVRAAVVDVRGEGNAKRLAAYVVPADGLPPAPRELRAHLAARLPEALVPTWYVHLPQLPITPSGKVDRRALPAPGSADAVQSQSHVEPRGAAQETVAAVWRDLLDVPRVSAHDDFLALGGHSLLATRAVSRVAELLGVVLDVRDLFEAPTVAAFAARADAAPRSGGGAAIPKAGEGPYPASFAQERLWFLDRLAPGGASYNVPLVLDLDGPLDVDALTATVTALAQRHAALRTRLVAHDGRAYQVVTDGADIGLAVEDLRQLPRAERDAAAAGRARQESEHPFDLAAGPLFRALLLRIADERAVLLLTLHHAVCDGGSVPVLLRDTGALYTAALRGTEPELPDLAVQYPDYAVWQRDRLAGAVREAQAAYWKERLAGAVPALELPTDRSRPAVQRHRGGTFPLQLSPELTRGLDGVARAHGATRFMVLMACFQLLMGRYADTRDVTVGTPASGRTAPELNDLIGFFVNTLAIRTHWRDEDSFATVLGRVRSASLGAHAHQELPFEQVVEEVRPPRDPSRSPLFQVMLAMQHVPTSTTALAGLDVTVRESTGAAAKFDFTVAWDEASLETGALRGHVEYDQDLFDRGTAEAMAGHYLTLVESALRRPGAPVRELRMAADAEPVGLDRDARAAAPDAEGGVLDMFAAAVARAPHHPAVRQAGVQLDYAELDRRSNAVGAGLLARGVGGGDTVLVHLDRGPHWPVALLGVLKAGAAYVPVEAGAPRERLRAVVEDARPALVLGTRSVPDPKTGAVPFAAVEDLVESASQAPAATRRPHLSELAYVVHTSGSTGRPKGVCVSHGNLAQELRAVSALWELGAHDRVLQFASLGFDVAAEELFSALVSGATVVIPPPGPVPGVAELVALARQEELTVLNLPGSYWHEWVAVLDRHSPGDCPALRLVVVGSERVDGGRLAEWRSAVGPEVRWMNAYGPTETTITATLYEPGGADDGPVPSTVPIGRPLPGARAYVLDAALGPVPPGVPGDLYIAGPGVTRGYLGDPVRTARAYLPDPWGAPGERMYATGDRARRTGDGVLEFLGRGDDQVKLRGYRIEPGEVEAALASHPRVGEAAVVLREDVPGHPALVGYVTLNGPSDEAELRAHVGTRVPGYMVPAAVVVLERLPRGATGKVDRRTLPPPASSRSAAARRAPVGVTERTVAGVWCEVLALPEVGGDDNFFDIGGHSLLMVRVQTRLAEVLDRQIAVVDLFRYPTVRSLAKHLAAEPEHDIGTSTGHRRAAARRKQHTVRGPRRRAVENRKAENHDK
ncbi:amino acid adenylation domain-containing protein [Streptomyces xanthochromogenes]|uniref:amino acid adenylation domain-containing protein n=1 Tax=Streptomyces xanthochromogenes TaxID=67384 RepID=UPI0037F1D33F